MKNIIKKILFLIPVGLLMLPIEVGAENWLGVPSVGDLIAAVGRFIGTIISSIMGVFLWFSGLLVDFALTMNMERLVGNNELVTVGWEISRDVANLGFVLVIIIIAFATIFRYKDYAAKKALSGLIIAAILVNFSLAIAGAVIDFSHILTKFFLQDRIGMNKGAWELSEHIAGAFSIQRLVIEDDDLNLRFPPDPETEAGALNTFSTAAVMALTSIAFTIIFTLIAALGLLALAILLLFRYVALSILLILAPIAWLLYAVPGYQSELSKWWTNFIKWTFFAPAVTFFIYLMVLTAEELSKFPMELTAGFSGMVQNILVQGSQMVVMLGLLIGGLVASLELGVKTSDAAQKAWKSTKEGSQKWASRKGRQYGSAPFRKKFKMEGEDEAKSVADRAQDWTKSDSRLKRIVGKTFVRPLATATTAGGEDIIKEHEDSLKGKSTDQVRAILKMPMSTGKKIAAINKLVKDGKIAKEDVAKHLNEKTKKQFKNFGRGGDFKKLEKAAGMSMEMRTALGGESEQALRTASASYIKKHKKNDMKDMPWNEVAEALADGKGALGLEPEDLKRLYEDNVYKDLATENSSVVSNILPNLSAKGLEQFKKDYEKAIKQEMKDTSPTGNPDKYNKLEDTLENFGKVIGNYSIGFYADPTSSSGDSKSSEKSDSKPDSK
ncbi:MAG: hypothetical protein WD471_01655 [Candidatus Paceibacterota bacterium]